MKISPAKRIRGNIKVPPDKSITHRALIFSAIARTSAELWNLLECDDTLRTFKALKQLGIQFKGDFKHLEVRPREFVEPISPLYCGNSGTTARLMTGLLAAKKGFYILYGDESLSRRPMRRVVEPLRKMGANIAGRNDDDNLPIAIKGEKLLGHRHELKIASAQVKSALLLAGLNAEGETVVKEPYKSRDHSERLLKIMGADILENGCEIIIRPSELSGISFEIPGDFSSAAFFITLAVLHPNAEIIIEGVNLNETRLGLLKTLKDMGANIDWEIVSPDPEPVGTIKATSSHLKGVEVDASMIPSMIDELPLLALAGVFAEGITKVSNAYELRKKESDRIKATVENFKKLGIEIEEYPDGFAIQGPQKLKSGKGTTYGDHRIAMMLAIAGALSEEGVHLDDVECVGISFPTFFQLLEVIAY